MKRIVSALIVGLAVCAAVLPASAQEEKKWDFGFAPFYLWAASIEGDTTLGGGDKETKVEFGDIFDQLEGVVFEKSRFVYERRVVIGHDDDVLGRIGHHRQGRDGKRCGRLLV